MSRLPALAVLVVGCIVAGGCSGDPEADPTAATEPTTVATTAPTTATPTAPTTGSDLTEPTLPAAATQPGAQGAEAFVRYYIKLFNYSVNTGDTDQFRAASDNCSGCDDYSDYIDGVYADGGWFKTDGWMPRSVETFRGSSGYTLIVAVDTAPIRYAETSGGGVKRAVADKDLLRYVVEMSGSRWTVAGLHPGDELQ